MATELAKAYDPKEAQAKWLAFWTEKVGFEVEDYLPDVAAKIGVELRNQYILGYSPINKERDGKYRKVLVKLVAPKRMPPLRAFFRQGYYAPVQ